MQEIFRIFIQWFIPFACAGGFALISKQLKENKTSNSLIEYLKNESIEIRTCKTKKAVLRLNQISENAENKTRLPGT